MIKLVLAVLSVLCTVSVALAKDIAFNDLTLVDAGGGQSDASLVFSESNKAMIIRVAGRDDMRIPYDKIDKFSYDYTQKNRDSNGAKAAAAATMGVGAVVMLTKSKTHWLYVHYHQESGSRSVILRMDKKNYKRILETAKAQTGKQVEFLNDAGA
jgi:hypothetical protein